MSIHTIILGPAITTHMPMGAFLEYPHLPKAIFIPMSIHTLSLGHAITTYMPIGYL